MTDAERENEIKDLVAQRDYSDERYAKEVKRNSVLEAQLTELRQAAIWLINPNGSPHANQQGAIVALESLLRRQLIEEKE